MRSLHHFDVKLGHSNFYFDGVLSIGCAAGGYQSPQPSSLEAVMFSSALRVI